MSFEEQIMSKDKYPSIKHNSQVEATVFIILQMFLQHAWFRRIMHELKYLMDSNK